ncbi:MAG: type II toxin-antitoxin system VapC family toxin [Desulfamplus sp.]
MIIDTDILIWYLRGNENALKVVKANTPFSISAVTYIELIQGMRNKNELRLFKKQIQKWNVDIIQINKEISSRAMFYVEEFALSHSMMLADALIAATVIENSGILITANDKHYKFIPDIEWIKFDPITNYEISSRDFN